MSTKGRRKEGQVDPKAWSRLDFRDNLIVDRDNPMLILKAWRDYGRYSGRAHLGASHGEDALSWNVFRTLQAKYESLEIARELLKLQDTVDEVLFWGCDPDGKSETQQILSCLIRDLDGQAGGTMTEPDLVFVTHSEVCIVECKGRVEVRRDPWGAQASKGKRAGWTKRWKVYSDRIYWNFEPLPQKSGEVETIRSFYQLVRMAVYSRLLARALGRSDYSVASLVDRSTYKSHPTMHKTYTAFRDWCDFCAVLEIRFWQELLDYKLPSEVASKITELSRN